MCLSRAQNSCLVLELFPNFAPLHPLRIHIFTFCQPQLRLSRVIPVPQVFPVFCSPKDFFRTEASPLSSFLPPSSVSRFSLLASSDPRLLFLFLCLPPSHCWVRSVGRKSSYVFTFCRDTCTPASLCARVQNITAGSYIKPDI